MAHTSQLLGRMPFMVFSCSQLGPARVCRSPSGEGVWGEGGGGAGRVG